MRGILTISGLSLGLLIVVYVKILTYNDPIHTPPEGAAAMVFQYLEGGSNLVLFSAVVMPLCQLIFAYAAHKRLSEIVLPWILQQLASAAKAGTTSKVALFLKPLMEDGCWLLKHGLDLHKDFTEGIVTAINLPALSATMKLLLNDGSTFELEGELPPEAVGFVYFMQALCQARRVRAACAPPAREIPLIRSPERDSRERTPETL